MKSSKYYQEVLTALSKTLEISKNQVSAHMDRTSLDSVTLVSLVLNLSEQLDIDIDEIEFQRKDFESIESIINSVEKWLINVQ